MSMGGALGGSGDRLPVRLEHAADRPAVVGEAPHVLQGVPAAAGAGDLQPGWDPEARYRRGEATRAINSLDLL